MTMIFRASAHTEARLILLYSCIFFVKCKLLLRRRRAHHRACGFLFRLTVFVLYRSTYQGHLQFFIVVDKSTFPKGGNSFNTRELFRLFAFVSLNG